jgi:two-component system sensor histidine kinase UhpB
MLESSLRIFAARPAAVRYAVAVLSPIAAALMLWLTMQYRDPTAPGLLFLAAVIAATWVGGTRPAILAMALSYLAFRVLYLPGRGLSANWSTEVPRLMTFVVVAAWVIWIIAAERRTRDDLRANNEALRESQHRLEEAQRIANIGHWVRDVATGDLTWSEELFRIFGLPPQVEPLPEARWRAMIHPDDRVRIATEFKNALAGIGPDELEYRIVRPDGEVRYVHSQREIVGDFPEGPVRAFGVAQDVTERRQAEEQLRESERWMRAAGRIAQVGYWEYDFLTDRITWSDEAARIYGQPLEVRNHSSAAIRQLVHPDDRPIFNDGDDRARAGEDHFQQEYRVIRPDGEQRVVETIADVLRDSEGRPFRFVGAVQDITERKASEARLQATTQQLRALSARVQRVREEEAARIAREIHDELGAALSSLKWDLEELDEDLSAGAPGGTSRSEKIHQMIRLADTTIDTVRRISSELRPTALDELGLVEAMRWSLDQFQARTGILIYSDGLPDRVDLAGEQATAVFRILQEALTNVLRHAQARRIDLSMRHEQGEFVFALHDNGRGISEAERTGTQSLGLLGMRERASLIGGDLRIEGMPGLGTTITLRVPQAAPIGRDAPLTEGPPSGPPLPPWPGPKC